MVVLEKTLESPLDSKGIKPVNLKGNHSWIFIGRTDAEAKTPVLWLPDVRSWLIGKDPDWCWERLKAGGEGDDRGWDGWMALRLDGHEFEQAPGVDDGQGCLVCCSPWGCKELDMTEWLNWTDATLERNLTFLGKKVYLLFSSKEIYREVKILKSLSLEESLAFYRLRVYPSGASQLALVVKNLPVNAGDIRHMGSIPGSGRSPGVGSGNPLSTAAWKIP